MKNGYLFLLISFMTFSAFTQTTNWESMGNEDKIWVLEEIEYYQSNDPDLPLGTKVISISKPYSHDFNINEVDAKFKTIVLQVLSEFEAEVSREEIDQSPYELAGQEEVSSFYLLVNSQGEVLGGSLDVFQEGKGGDVSWSAGYLFGSEGKLFSGVDAPSFSWSGH